MLHLIGGIIGFFMGMGVVYTCELASTHIPKLINRYKERKSSTNKRLNRVEKEIEELKLYSNNTQ